MNIINRYAFILRYDNSTIYRWLNESGLNIYNIGKAFEPELDINAVLRKAHIEFFNCEHKNINDLELNDETKRKTYFLKVNEFRKGKGLTQQTIYNWINEGKLEAYKIKGSENYTYLIPIYELHKLYDFDLNQIIYIILIWNEQNKSNQISHYKSKTTVGKILRRLKQETKKHKIKINIKKSTWLKTINDEGEIIFKEIKGFNRKETGRTTNLIEYFITLLSSKKPT